MNPRHVRASLICILASWLGLFAAQASDPPTAFTAKVVKVSDGDVISVTLGNLEFEVRLNGIDAPDQGQPFATNAKRALNDAVLEKEVRIAWLKRDKKGRILGEVFLGSRRMTLEMVSDGYAWHHVKYSKDEVPARPEKKEFDEDLARAESEAKKARKGLWADSDAIAPWDFRDAKQAAATLASPPPLPANPIPLAKTAPSQPPPSAVKKYLDDLSKRNSLVYVTPSGTKYHLDNCRFLTDSRKAIPLQDAKKKYAPCSVCNPPR